MTAEEPTHVNLVALLSGDLAPADRPQAVAHLEGCAACRSELITTAALVGELSDARRHPPIDPAQVPPLDLSARNSPRRETRRPVPIVVGGAESGVRRRRGRIGAAIATAAVITAAVLGGVVGWAASPNAPEASVRLAAVGSQPSAAIGVAQMEGRGASQKMRLTISGLRAPNSGDRYEVWLLDTRTGHAREVGSVASPARGGSATYRLPAAETVGYNAIDVSLQTPADGARHSAHSVLRGAIS